MSAETAQIALPRSGYPYARNDAPCHMEFAHGGHPWGTEPNGSHLPNWCDGVPAIPPGQ